MNWSSPILWFIISQTQEAQFPNYNNETVDWVVAMVDLHVITHSDLAFEQALQQYYTLDFAPLQEKRKRNLEFLIDIHLLCDLANGVDIYQVSSSKLEEELAELRSKFTTIQDFNQFLLSHGVTENSLKEQLNCYLSGEQVAYRYVVTTQNSQPEVQMQVYTDLMKELWERKPPRIISAVPIPMETKNQD
ncbi:MAG: hypothetical protein VX026_06365 [Myxococcota bacterium]|nr:hypothetical protein [Myxococcota bacterium]